LTPLEAQLAQLELQLRRRARLGTWVASIWTFVLGPGLQIVTWTTKGSVLDHIALAAGFAALTFVPGSILLARRVGRTPPLITRLRMKPQELRLLKLQWVTYATGPRGRLVFTFADSWSDEVTLDVEAARVAFDTVAAAYPWAR
jgi:hypothetical protein